MELGRSFETLGLRVPGSNKHGLDEVKVLACRLERLEHFLKAGFQLRLRNALAPLIAPMMVARVVGVVLVLSLAPSPGQRITAFGAGHGATERKVVARVFSSGLNRALFQALLYAPKSFLAHNAFVFGLPHRDAPTRHRDVSAVHDLLKHPLYGLLNDRAVRAVLGKLGLRFQIADHFRLRLELSACEALQGIANDRSVRFVVDQDLPAPAVGGIFEANRRD